MGKALNYVVVCEGVLPNNFNGGMQQMRGDAVNLKRVIHLNKKGALPKLNDDNMIEKNYVGNQFAVWPDVFKSYSGHTITPPRAARVEERPRYDEDGTFVGMEEIHVPAHPGYYYVYLFGESDVPSSKTALIAL